MGKEGLNVRIILCILISFNYGIVCAQDTKIDSLYTLLHNSHENNEKVSTLYNLARLLYQVEPQKAIEFANQGLQLSEKNGYQSGIGDCLNVLGVIYFQIGEYDSAFLYFKQMLEITEKSNNIKGKAGALDNLAVIYFRKGDIDKALELRQQAIGIYQKLNDNTHIGNGYTWVGNIYKEVGKYTEALEYYFKSLRILEAENDLLNTGFPLLNISSIYRVTQQYNLAKNYAIEAQKIFVKANYQDGIGTALFRIAIIYLDEENYDSSVYYLQEAKKILEKTHNKSFLTLIDQNLGACYQSMNRLDDALRYFNTTLDNSIDMGDSSLMVYAIHNIGTIYMEQGDYQKALIYLNKSNNILRKHKDPNISLEDYKCFVNIFSHLNQPDSVSKYLIKIQDTYAILFNEQNSKSIAEMQAKYETEKKDKEILALNLENEKRESNIILLENQNEINRLRLENSIIENDKNAQRLHLANLEKGKQKADIELLTLIKNRQAQSIKDEQDARKRMFNYFSLGFASLAMLLFLGFLSYRNRKLKKEAVLKQQAAELSLQVSENNIKALRSQMNPHFIFNSVQTIERLLNESRISDSKLCLDRFSNLTRTVLENSNKREISLKEELDTLKLYIELEKLRFSNPFEYDIRVEEGIDPETTLIPPLILQPFVENALKHGFRDETKRGMLSITIIKENDFLRCTVEDNGVGRKHSMSIKPVSGFKKESLGLKITEERLNLISESRKQRAYFKIEDLLDKSDNPLGTRVLVFLPYEQSI